MVRCLLLLLYFAGYFSACAQVQLNEICFHNYFLFADQDKDYPTWLELYNNSAAVANLEGFYLSDNTKQARKWRIPDVQMQPYSYLIVFLSGKNKLDCTENSGIPNRFLHTNFKIDEKDTLLLSNAAGEKTDAVGLREVRFGHAYGRVGDSRTMGWAIFENPTPKKSNNTSLPYQCYTKSPEIIGESGFYQKEMWVMIESEPEQDVYYTTDGSEPTSRSKRYQEPVIINSSQIIKAVAYSRTCLPSEVVERTYLFEKKPSLPVVFLTGNVGDWFSVERGIYEKGMYAEPQPPHHGANFWQDWTIPVFFEWLDEKGDLRFHQKAGAKIHGAGSRAFDMKSLQIKTLGGLYGNKLKFSFFPQQAKKSYHNILLKNSGQNFKLSHLNDPLVHELIAPLGTVDVQQYRPVVVYINGRYWGIHDLRDKADKYYLAEKYGIKAKSVEIVEGCGLEAVEGTTEHFRAMRDYIFNNDLSALQHYEWVKAHLNIENFCDYMITNLYVVNKDWHQSGNVRAWRSPEYDGGRWHFFLTDLDISMGHIGMAGENNLMEIFNANSPQAKMLKMLLQNPDFKKYFTQRFNDLLNSTFAPEHVLATLERLAAQLEPEMPRHCGRWGMSVVEWKEKYVGEIVTFAKLRTAIIRRYLREQLLLGSEIKMVSSVEPPASGSIAINTYFPPQYPFTGIYFSAQNIDLNAYPAEGYRFAYWELGNSRIKESCVSVPLRDSSVVKAHFEKQ